MDPQHRVATDPVGARLTRAPYKRYVEIGEGTHTIIIMAKNRMRLFQEVQPFLDERLQPNP